MVKLEQLITLEKKPHVDLQKCIVRFDGINQETGNRQRILESVHNRTYYHEMSEGIVVRCFEIAFDWKPFNKFYVYAYTPDDRHLCRIEVRDQIFFDVLPLNCEQIRNGDSCSHDGISLVVEDRNHIRMNNVSIPVVQDSEYVYSLRRDSIHAMNAASGLYCFLENISARKAMGNYPIFHDIWRVIAQHYGAVQKEAAA